MEETPVLSDPGFVVEWQLADDIDRLIDLSSAESEALQPDLARVAPSKTLPTGR